MSGNIVGNYKIIDKIGEGGMGAVFKGVDLMLEREVAIKMLRPELARQPNVVERFRTEAVTLAKLNHPNVATLHSFFRQGDDFFMVMEFVRGETLDSIIRRRGAIPCDNGVQLFCMALEGIDHAHQMGIIHRDIKPANMMLTDTGSIKVMDFGIARVLGTDRLTKAGHLIGTVEYMSPEQVRGEETDARSDIYSLGILLYEMLTGRVPFNGASEYELMRCQIEAAPTPPRTFAPQISLTVEQAIMRALAKKREARYQTASDFRAVLLQQTGSLITKVMEVPTAGTGYAAPATQPDRPVNATPSDVVLKETRLAGDQSYTPVAAAAGIKETRLAQDAAIASGAPGGQGYYAQMPAEARASILSKLNWKHYAGAGAVLVALIAASLALLGGGSKPSTQPASVAQPAQQAPVESAPAATPKSIPQSNPPAPQIAPASPPGPTDNQSSTGAGAVKPAPSRGRTRAVQQPGQERASPRREQRADTGRDSAKRDEKKVDGKPSKIGDAAQAVGGFVKGILGKKKKQ